ncbi:hypothetical protein Areg01_78940 [Actinoplanes regularis]|nr:hypothetical protein Areg01_78940 [Actinoplanes regularis]
MTGSCSPVAADEDDASGDLPGGRTWQPSPRRPAIDRARVNPLIEIGRVGPLRMWRPSIPWPPWRAGFGIIAADRAA